MALLQQGELEAFHPLYVRYRTRLYNFLLRILEDRARAEELFQETMLRVYLHRRSYRPQATFRTWLYTIARHLCLNLLSREKGERLVLDAPALHLHTDPPPNPQEHFERIERAETVRRAIRSLPLPQREVILLTRFEGLSTRDVAQILGKSESAVRVMAHRALRLLKDHLSL